MAKAILTSKKVKKFSYQKNFTPETSLSTIVSWFAKYFFMGNSP